MQVILCVNFLFVYVVLAELRNEAIRNAEMQAAIKQLGKFNYDYMMRNNIDWNDYLQQLKNHTNEARFMERYYIPYCEKLNLDNINTDINNADKK
ncbi:MAG: hypothetical protein LBP59_13515 [Planctomycetaceae bacterium]|nr:hypothetical protein [Planctomycetaceae bacterium]